MSVPRPTSPPATEPLVGRTELLARVRRALASAGVDDAPRLVTLSGPVGVGKTRLAREVARLALADGEAEAVRTWDAEGVGAGLEPLAAAALRELGAEADVAAALEACGQVLVVVDGLDVVDEATRGALAAWLGGTDARFLVTSRGRVGLPEEQVVEVPPLALPGGDAFEGEAAEYFLACARKVRDGYAPTPAEAGFLVELVRELDGLPLALALAAPRLAVMGPAALLHRVRSSRSLLHARNAPGAWSPRHRSFDAALEGSWQALVPWEKSALAQLTVFAGFTAEGAEAVLELEPAGGVAPRPLEALQVLRDKSLLATRAHESGELRLELLHGVADFVRRHGEARTIAEAAGRHARHYGALAARALAGLAERAELAAEHRNLAAVVSRVLQAPVATSATAEPALWALIALASVTDPDPASSPHGALLERVLEATRNSGADPRLYGRALLLRGVTRRERGDLAGAARDLAQALHLSRSVQAGELEGRALMESALLLELSGDGPGAKAHARGAAACLAGTQAPAAEAEALLVLAGIEARARDLGVARAAAERALALATSVGDPLGERRARCELARVLLDRGARDAAREELRAARRPPDPARRGEDDPRLARWAAESELVEGLCLHDEGETREAARRYAACADQARRRGFPSLEARALVHRAVVMVERQAFAEAYAELRLALTSASGDARALAEALVFAVSNVASPPAMVSAGASGAASTPLTRAIAFALSESHDPARFAAARAKLALEWSDSALARVVMRAFDRHAGEVPAPPPGALVVGSSGRWFRPPAAVPVSLERRRPLAAILDHLSHARQTRPGGPVPWDELQQAAWPGERMLASAGAHRVRVAISTLRKLGLRDQLRTTDEGYLLDPGCPIARVEDASART